VLEKLSASITRWARTQHERSRDERCRCRFTLASAHPEPVEGSLSKEACQRKRIHHALRTGMSTDMLSSKYVYLYLYSVVRLYANYQLFHLSQ
jgi:hypothetical protein